MQIFLNFHCSEKKFNSQLKVVGNADSTFHFNSFNEVLANFHHQSLKDSNVYCFNSCAAIIFDVGIIVGM